jgi:hypothetical protein
MTSLNIFDIVVFAPRSPASTPAHNNDGNIRGSDGCQKAREGKNEAFLPVERDQEQYTTTARRNCRGQVHA